MSAVTGTFVPDEIENRAESQSETESADKGSQDTYQDDKEFV